MANLALGIDTGGTYTDGVIWDLDQKSIWHKIKVITTRHDLGGAVENCLDQLLLGREALQLINDIRMVSLSTTLATNAIVEGQGAEVGLILIGYDPEFNWPTPHRVYLKGGCTIKGRIREELDLDEVKASILSLKGQVDAFAVSGYLSVRNPSQEEEVAELIRDLVNCPVVLAHQLTSDLGFIERTTTAIFNARLIPLISSLINHVKRAMAKKGINAPLMVVKGDGSLISQLKAQERPVETLLSGPAASVVGAQVLTNIEEGLVVDMGGTTTDVALLQQGRPAINRRGALVGGWLTRVQAADIITTGLGGDSLIAVSKSKELTVGPQRVFPLAWIVAEHPHLEMELKEVQLDYFFPINAQPVTILCYIKDAPRLNLSEGEKQVLEILKEKPHTLYKLSKILGKDPDLIPYQRLVNVGSLHRGSLTPTDILHGEGKFNNWKTAAAVLGIEITALRMGKDFDEFIAAVKEKINFNLFAVMLSVLAKGQDGLENLDFSQYPFFKMLKSAENNQLLSFEARSKVKVIGVGAPASAYIPAAVDSLFTETILPKSCEVANAVGTVSGKVVVQVEILIKPGERGGFLVHSPLGREGFVEFKAACDYGRDIGRRYVLEQASLGGATDIEVVVDQKDRYGELTAGNKDDRLFIESEIMISAVGKPWGGINE